MLEPTRRSEKEAVRQRQRKQDWRRRRDIGRPDGRTGQHRLDTITSPRRLRQQLVITYLQLCIGLQRPCTYLGGLLVCSLDHHGRLRGDLQAQSLTARRHTRNRLQARLQLSNCPCGRDTTLRGRILRAYEQGDVRCGGSHTDHTGVGAGVVLVLVPMLMLMLVGDAACRVLGSRRYGRGKVGGFQVGARETTVECPAGKEREGGGQRIVLPEGSSPVTAYVCPVWSWHWRRERATDCRPRY